jgi:hypothetical protein
MGNSGWGGMGLKLYLHAKTHGRSRRKTEKAKARRLIPPFVIPAKAGIFPTSMGFRLSPE